MQLQEEACISARNLDKRGILTFCFHDKPQPWEVHGKPCPLFLLPAKCFCGDLLFMSVSVCVCVQWGQAQ